MPLAVSYSNLDGTGWSKSSGTAVLSASFTTTTAGWIMVYLPYSVSVDLAASSGSTESAYGKTRASISLAKSGGTTATEFIEFFSTVYGSDTFGVNESGNFGFGKWFGAGETGTFTAEVFTETATSNMVPLPGALLLFAPGLACFFVFC
jgi:hypothetical protein